MTDSSSQPVANSAASQMTRQAQNMSIGIGATILAVLTAAIGIILLTVGTFVNTSDAESVHSGGFYFVGATGILAIIAYTDGVCRDAGEPIADKKEQ